MNVTLEKSHPVAASPSAAVLPILVAVVEDNPGLRRSLQRLLAHAPGLKCIGAWDCAESAFDPIAQMKPDVVLMDINLPGLSGIEATARVKAESPGTQVVMVTVYEDTDSIFRALKAGACGYLLKRASSQEIIEAIRDVQVGGSPMTSEIARKVVRAFQGPPPEHDTSAVLSAREREILELLSRGYVNKEIADKLSIAYQTVKVHLKHIYEKLHVRSRTEALIKFMADKGSGPDPSSDASKPPGRPPG
jgi:DNA-binding NarL/FixJ family response regulator